MNEISDEFMQNQWGAIWQLVKDADKQPELREDAVELLNCFLELAERRSPWFTLLCP